MAHASTADRTSRLGAARAAVSFTFLAFGLCLGMWFVHIPVVVGRLGIEPAVLGLALLLVGLGALLAPPIAALIVARIGSRRACQVLTVATIAAILVAILAQDIVMLFAGTAVTGVMGGSLNVAANTQASEVETALARPAMSSFHGFFSLGGVLAAGIGSIIFAAGWGDGRGAVVASIVLAAGALVADRYYLPDRPRTEVEKRSSPTFALPARSLLGLSLIVLLCNVVEGSVGDWSALFLLGDKLAEPAIATAGYAMFALAMTLSRFAGGPLVTRLGPKWVVIFGGLLVALGMALVILAPGPIVSASGFLILGLGAANVSPVLMSVAGRTPGVEPAIGVATVSSALAAGLLLGPPLVGFLAQVLGLATALGLVGSFGLFVAGAAALRVWDDSGTPAAPALAA